MNTQHATAVFGNGCFWCTEAIFRMLDGVSSLTPGYTGGTQENPTYEQVCGGNTGHAEVIRLTYDPQIISYNDLLTVFFATHDPTTLNQQGADVGTQYRSAIFYNSEEQKEEAVRFIQELSESHTFTDPIVTEVTPLGTFYEAEDYHRNYYERNPQKSYCALVIAPKVTKLQERFEKLLIKNKEPYV